MKDTYESPFSARYSSREMQYLFSPDKKFITWRKLWVALAESEKELGYDITDAQIAEMKANVDKIDYSVADAREKIVRHDVMAHIYTFALLCPTAAPIIHLGATSCYVTDNTDLILLYEATGLIISKLVAVIRRLRKFALEYKDMPTLAYTHFQPAQPTTVGKRATLWLNDLLSDLEDAEHFRDGLRLLGSKGATGTQASFLELFGGDHAKVAKLDSLIAQKMGFTDSYPVSGQTYSRKIDSRALNVLSGVAQSAAKFSNDLRLLQHLKEIEEPFEKSQVGSSAMAYKRNPMMCERMAALARFIVADSLNPAMTASAQWLERTLDDSANRRISVAEAFLATDGLLDIFTNVTDGLVVYPKVIEKHLLSELPFMATENIMMDAVSAGGDRQILHERIRELSRKAAGEIKMEGKENDLIGMLKKDPLFAKVKDRIDGLLQPELFVGMAPEQVEEFIGNDVDKALEKYAGMPDLKNDVTI